MIRDRLRAEGRKRDQALFNLAIDSKLSACDLVALQVKDVWHRQRVRSGGFATHSPTGRVRTVLVLFCFPVFRRSTRAQISRDVLEPVRHIRHSKVRARRPSATSVLSLTTYQRPRADSYCCKIVRCSYRELVLGDDLYPRPFGYAGTLRHPHYRCRQG
jgi:hypothetical protein